MSIWLHGLRTRVTLRRFRRRSPPPWMQPVRRGLRIVICGPVPRDKTRTRGNAMLGLMQDWPLLCHRIIDHAATNHAGRAIVTRSVEGAIHETNYAEVRARALRLAQ